MALTEARTKANKKYHEKFDDIKVRVPKGERQMWQEHASTQGESLNRFICRAVAQAMENDSKK